MKYFANINSKNELVGIDLAELSRDGYGSEDVKNIEVTEEVYLNKEKYIYKKGKIVVNPNYETEKLKELRAKKHKENDEKAKEIRYSAEITTVIQGKECIFDTSEQTQRDLLIAFSVCLTGEIYNGWITNNGVELDLSLEDVKQISQLFKIQSSVYQLWNQYREKIEKAETIEEIERIELNYGRN